jgi:hypothetical protein
VPALRELQMQFASALFDGASEPIASGVRADGIDPVARIGIYRNNLREGFIRALSLEFPVIAKLVGREFFRQLALEFLAAHPSRSGNLHHIGEPFPHFLERRFGDGEYAWFADVARLEWAYQEAYIAAEAPPSDLQALRAMDPQRYEDLRFRLHPASRLVSSPYPIVRIWTANQDGAPDEHIDLGSGGDHVLVHRVGGEIEFHRLSASEFAFLEALGGGATLGRAYDRVHRDDPEFDLGAALRRFVPGGVLLHDEPLP